MVSKKITSSNWWSIDILISAAVFSSDHFVDHFLWRFGKQKNPMYKYSVVEEWFLTEYILLVSVTLEVFFVKFRLCSSGRSRISRGCRDYQPNNLAYFPKTKKKRSVWRGDAKCPPLLMLWKDFYLFWKSNTKRRRKKFWRLPRHILLSGTNVLSET